jgi:1-acyl-sn-glycerol-3-phosphate acyltransferase/membrane-associated phospholipid phosphatase/predicted protein tyrosine phosphatase
MGHLYRLARRTRGGLTAQAAGRSALLSVLFVGIYGGCNWLAAQRADVGVWYFEWERHIRFWPAMVVPYLSIDVFFIAAPFLCRDRDELRLFTRRITAAILTAGVCFVAMPLRFAFERPVADGWLGALFQQFTALDRPFNLVPSLHITLAVILADTYRRHTQGLLRFAVTVWFVLIGLSTVFTYQHHVVDVIGGLVLAALVFHGLRTATASTPKSQLRPSEVSQSHRWDGNRAGWSDSRGFRPDGSNGSPWKLGVGRWASAPRNVRVAAYYSAAAALSGIGAVVLWPWGSLLLWPAVSLATVGAAYVGVGPWVFAKHNGRMPLTTWMMLWPCLLGQRASLVWYRRQCRPHDAVTPRVWIGRQLNDHEAAQAVAAGVAAVVDLTPDFNETPVFTRLPYLNLPTLDLTAPDVDSLARGVRFVTAHAHHGVVYVHCKVGYSRSAAVVAAYLLASGHAGSTDEALAMIRRARPQVVIRPEIIECLAPRAAGTSRHSSPLRVVAAYVLAIAARVFCGSPAWRDTKPDCRPRIYYANHTSHLDFVVLWGSLPRDVRLRTRPVAGRDYWGRGVLRPFIARDFLNALLVDRATPHSDRQTTTSLAERSVEQSVCALDDGTSLIVFPEGTRGSGDDVQPFKSGLYHVCRMRPDVELVPVFLDNMHRILPKGEAIPVPLSGAVTFGAPLRLRPGESKAAFLARARHALLMVNRPCTPPSTANSRPSLRAS